MSITVIDSFSLPLRSLTFKQGIHTWSFNSTRALMNKIQALWTLSVLTEVRIGQKKPTIPGVHRATVHLAGNRVPWDPLKEMGSWLPAFVSGADLGLQLHLEEKSSWLNPRIPCLVSASIFILMLGPCFWNSLIYFVWMSWSVIPELIWFPNAWLPRNLNHHAIPLLPWRWHFPSPEKTGVSCSLWIVKPLFGKAFHSCATWD